MENSMDKPVSMAVSSSNQLSCPLCGDHDISLFHRDKVREYFRCSRCQLVSVPRQYWLRQEQEKAEYDLHTNDPDDQGYRTFLSRLTESLSKRIKDVGKGLDFGCGAGSPIPAMMTEKGHEVDLYDPYYFPDTILKERYDFITATEVAEHLRSPRLEFEKLEKLLIPGGYLGLMTKLVSSKEAFTSWHYIRDLTHICFYSEATFVFLAEQLSMELEIISSDVILMRKRGR